MRVRSETDMTGIQEFAAQYKSPQFIRHFGNALVAVYRKEYEDNAWLLIKWRIYHQHKSHLADFLMNKDALARVVLKKMEMDMSCMSEKMAEMKLEMAHAECKEDFLVETKDETAALSAHTEDPVIEGPKRLSEEDTLAALKELADSIPEEPKKDTEMNTHTKPDDIVAAEPIAEPVTETSPAVDLSDIPFLTTPRKVSTYINQRVVFLLNTASITFSNRTQVKTDEILEFLAVESPVVAKGAMKAKSVKPTMSILIETELRRRGFSDPCSVAITLSSIFSIANKSGLMTRGSHSSLTNDEVIYFLDHNPDFKNFRDTDVVAEIHDRLASSGLGETDRRIHASRLIALAYVCEKTKTNRFWRFITMLFKTNPHPVVASFWKRLEGRKSYPASWLAQASNDLFDGKNELDGEFGNCGVEGWEMDQFR